MIRPGFGCSECPHPEGIAFTYWESLNPPELVCEINGVERWRVGCSTYQHDPQCASDPAGNVLVVGQAHDGSGLLLIRSDSVKFPGVPCVTSRGAWVEWDAANVGLGWFVYSMVSPSKYMQYSTGTGDRVTFPVPLWPGGNGTTSQGCTQIADDGEFVWADPSRVRSLPGVGDVFRAVETHGIVLGQLGNRTGGQDLPAPAKYGLFVEGADGLKSIQIAYSPVRDVYAVCGPRDGGGNVYIEFTPGDLKPVPPPESEVALPLPTKKFTQPRKFFGYKLNSGTVESGGEGGTQFDPPARGTVPYDGCFLDGPGGLPNVLKQRWLTIAGADSLAALPQQLRFALSVRSDGGSAIGADLAKGIRDQRPNAESLGVPLMLYVDNDDPSAGTWNAEFRVDVDIYELRCYFLPGMAEAFMLSRTIAALRWLESKRVRRVVFCWQKFSRSMKWGRFGLRNIAIMEMHVLYEVERLNALPDDDPQKLRIEVIGGTDFSFGRDAVLPDGTIVGGERVFPELLEVTAAMVALHPNGNIDLPVLPAPPPDTPDTPDTPDRPETPDTHEDDDMPRQPISEEERQPILNSMAPIMANTFLGPFDPKKPAAGEPMATWSADRWTAIGKQLARESHDFCQANGFAPRSLQMLEVMRMFRTQGMTRDQVAAAIAFEK